MRADISSSTDWEDWIGILWDLGRTGQQWQDLERLIPLDAENNNLSCYYTGGG